VSDISFKKTPEQVDFIKSNSIEMNDELGIYFAWQTTPEALEEVLPQGMDMVLPIVFGYVTHIRKPSFCIPYLETSLMTIGKWGDLPGTLSISLLLDKGDTATFLGRDQVSIPKKTADKIELRREDDKVYANTRRLGVDLLTIEASVGEYNDPLCDNVLKPRSPGEEAQGNSFNFKFGFDPTQSGVAEFKDVRLISSPITNIYHSWEKLTVDSITLRESPDDPWAALPVVKPLGAAWTNFSCHMHGANILPVPDDAVDDTIAKSLAGRFDAVSLGITKNE